MGSKILSIERKISKRVNSMIEAEAVKLDSQRAGMSREKSKINDSIL